MKNSEKGNSFSKEVTLDLVADERTVKKGEDNIERGCSYKGIGVVHEASDVRKKGHVQVSWIVENLKRERIEPLRDAFDKVDIKENDLVIPKIEPKVEKLSETLTRKDEVDQLGRL